MTVHRRKVAALCAPSTTQISFDSIAMPPDWTRDAPCASTDPALFYPEQGVHGNPNTAKRLCWEKCSVREKCLEWALSFEAGDRAGHSRVFGIFGGLSATERKKLLAERFKQQREATVS